MGRQDTRSPPSQPHLDNGMVVHTSDKIGADNSGMSDDGPEPSVQGQLTIPDTIPEMTHYDQINPERVSQCPLSQPSSHRLPVSPNWPTDFHWCLHEGKVYNDTVTATYNEVIRWKRNVSWYHPLKLEKLLFLSSVAL